MQVDIRIGSDPAEMAYRTTQIALKSNIVASLLGLVMLAYLDRSDMGGHAIALLAVILLGFASVSFTMLRDADIIPSRELIFLGGTMIVAGLIIPVQTVYGAAFPADMLTIGFMILVAFGVQGLMQRSRKARMVAAWDTMIRGLVLAPIAALVGVVFFLLVGFPMAIALPAACLTVIAVNPLAALVVVVHGNPFNSLTPATTV